MKKYLIYSFLMLIFGILKAQLTIINNFNLPTASKVTDFPDMSSFALCGKNNTHYWIQQTDPSDGSQFKIFQRAFDNNTWEEISTLPIDYIPSIYNYKDVGDRMIWSGFKESYTIFPNNNGRTYTTEWNLYSCTDDIVNQSLISSKSLETSCPYNNSNPCSPWTGNYHVVDVGLVYFFANNQTDAIKEFSSNGGQTWQPLLSNLPIYNTQKIDSRFVCYDNTKLYISNFPDFSNVITSIFPDTLTTSFFPFFNNDTLNLILPNGICWVSNDLGQHWEIKQLSIKGIKKVWFRNNKYWFWTESTLFRASKIDGNYENVLPDGIVSDSYIWSLAPIDDEEWMAGINGRGIWRSTDNAQTWQLFHDGLPKSGLINIKQLGGNFIGYNRSYANWFSTNGVDWNSYPYSQDQNKTIICIF
jgi:hypothetical protein